MMENDWNGLPIPAGELPNTKILVWVVSPGMDCDEAWIRDYHAAIKFAQDQLYDIADSTDEEKLKDVGVSVSMKLRETTLEEYLEVTATE